MIQSTARGITFLISVLIHFYSESKQTSMVEADVNITVSTPCTSAYLRNTIMPIQGDAVST